MIELVRASRWYGEVIGLNDVTCQIGVGVTALLGQNGAGKSTLMRLITGQLKPTTGEVKVNGQAPFANPEVFRHLGYCPDIDSFPEHLSGREFVIRMGRLSGLSAADSKARTGELMHLVGMADRCDRPLQGYSKGMRQRIKLAQALVHDPKILLLDEPLNGLDPVGRHEFMDVLQRLAAEGKGILVSSHILFEVERMTSSILLLHRGRLLAAGEVADVRALIDRYPHRIIIRTPDPRAVAAACIHAASVLGMRINEALDEVEVETREPDAFYALVNQLGVRAETPIWGIESPDNNLESIYQYLVEA